MIDQPPLVWLPPKPAIIRPAPEIKKASFLPGGFPGGVVSGRQAQIETIVLADSNTSVSQTITVPETVVAGDLLVLYDRPASSSTPSGSAPPGWTTIDNRASGNYRMIFSYTIATGEEAGLDIDGASGGIFVQKRLLVFRTNRPMQSVQLGNVDAGLSSGTQERTALASQGTAPLVVVATYHMNTSDGTRAMSPAKDGELGSNNPGYCWIAWKIFNLEDTPVDVTASRSAESSSQGVQITYFVPSDK